MAAISAGSSLHLPLLPISHVNASSPPPFLLCRYQLCLASWGYCTAEEQAAAVQLPGVRLLTLPQFRELLRWGVVMEVRRRCPERTCWHWRLGSAAALLCTHARMQICQLCS